MMPPANRDKPHTGMNELPFHTGVDGISHERGKQASIIGFS
jgi:hypothetical protein